MLSRISPDVWALEVVIRLERAAYLSRNTDPNIYVLRCSAGLGGPNRVQTTVYASGHVLKVTLKDPYRSLRGHRGQRVQVVGSATDPTTHLPVCFSALVYICASSF